MPSDTTAPINAELVRGLFNYDAGTGKLTYKVSPRYGIKVGDEAGNAHPDGARRVMIKQRAYLYHRLCWTHYYGAEPKLFIDHINGDRADCRIVNLRDVELSCNAHNTVAPRKHNKLKVMGVSRSGEKYVASIQVGKKAYYLGTFDTVESAHAAYVEVKKTFIPQERTHAL